VRTFAVNHTSGASGIRVAWCGRGWWVDDPYRRDTDRLPNPRAWVMIGDMTRKDIAYPNEWLSDVLDDGPPIPHNWSH